MHYYSAPRWEQGVSNVQEEIGVQAVPQKRPEFRHVDLQNLSVTVCDIYDGDLGVIFTFNVFFPSGMNTKPNNKKRWPVFQNLTTSSP